MLNKVAIPRRMRIAPTRYGIDEYVGTALVTQLEEPQSITEALESDLSEQWREAADSEYQSLMQNETWNVWNYLKDVNLLDANEYSRQNEKVMAKFNNLKLDLKQKDLLKNME